jgi:hypothetical protein
VLDVVQPINVTGVIHAIVIENINGIDIDTINIHNSVNNAVAAMLKIFFIMLIICC